MAAAPGRVVEVSYSSGWGNRVVIDHGVINGQALKTSYNHAASYQVAVGDTVARGQVIGAVGSTGVSTGCHLHFQVWLDGRATDPASVLPG
jgi:murein DD-endopeptidase MepM/ murein hydrolase activator NlpD